MRLQVPKFFQTINPSLPFRHRSLPKTVPPEEDGARRPAPRTSARGFAVKFYDILSNESSDIITWTRSGLAFQVVDYARFSEEILLKYFRHNKFSSFRRQLNLYGYRKVIKGPDAGAYMHPSFQRGRPDLLCEVKKGKVPHYDVHGVNEIHGQHFRHHPPGPRRGDDQNIGQISTVKLTPTQSALSNPVTPEIRGDVHVASRRAAPMPPPNSTPGTETMRAMDNMSLEGVDPYVRESPPMEALTLTPAWGGGLQERHPGGESIRQQEGGDLKISSGDSGGGGVGKGSGGGSQNLGGGGGGNSGSSAVPTAYWHRQRKRRTMSSQLVFDTAAPENTEEILQADPSLGDVMNAICQCMEVQSSSEDSIHSKCSFKDSPRRSSVSDLLSCMSWESAIRAAAAPGKNNTGSTEAMIANAENEASSQSRAMGNGHDGGDFRTGSPPPVAPFFDQRPSFDPNRDPREHSNHNHEQQNSAWPFEAPDRESTNLGGVDPYLGGDIRHDKGDTVTTKVELVADQCEGVNDNGGGSIPAQPKTLSRESSRERPVARIFAKSPTLKPTPVAGDKDSNVQDWGSTAQGQVQTNRWKTKDDQLSSVADNVSTSSWENSGSWRTPGMSLQHEGGGRSTTASTLSTVTDTTVADSMAVSAGEFTDVFMRPSLDRIPSLSLPPSRRPTINESHEVNRLLAKEDNLLSWLRIADDPDSLLLAKSIGDYLG